MSSNLLNTNINSGNIIRRTSMRVSKDKANARIFVPLDDISSPKTRISRSKTVLVKKTCNSIKEITTLMETSLTIASDDDDEDKYSGDSETESSEDVSSEDLSNDDELLEEISKPASSKIKRHKTFNGGKIAQNKENHFSNIKTVERKKMTASSFAEEMPCRDKEFDQLYLSISTLLCNGDSGCIFVVGVPGTGKTATVSAVIDCLESERFDIPIFRRAKVNGMRVTEAREVYSVIYKKLTGYPISKSKAVSSLENELLKKSKSKKPTVIVIDEIDQLHTKKEDVLYKIFGWTQRRESRLIVIAIANTMDLPERLSQNKVTSRAGVTRYIFQPYSHDQLLTILMAKFTKKGTMDNIDPKALEFAAKKVAAASGDVRRILEISNRLFDFQKEGKIINLPIVHFILKEMFSQPKIAALRYNCSFYEKLFLKAIVATFKSNGLEEAKLKDVQRTFMDICCNESVQVPNSSQIYAILVSLGSYKLILYDSLALDIGLTLRLNCSQENVYFALSDK